MKGEDGWVDVEGAFGTVLALGGVGPTDLVKIHVKRPMGQVRGVGANDRRYYERGVVCRLGGRAYYNLPRDRWEGEARDDAFVVFAIEIPPPTSGGIWLYPEEVIAWKRRHE